MGETRWTHTKKVDHQNIFCNASLEFARTCPSSCGATVHAATRSVQGNEHVAPHRAVQRPAHVGARAEGRPRLRASARPLRRGILRLPRRHPAALWVRPTEAAVRRRVPRAAAAEHAAGGVCLDDHAAYADRGRTVTTSSETVVGGARPAPCRCRRDAPSAPHPAPERGGHRSDAPSRACGARAPCEQAARRGALRGERRRRAWRRAVVARGR